MIQSTKTRTEPNYWVLMSNRVFDVWMKEHPEYEIDLGVPIERNVLLNLALPTYGPSVYKKEVEDVKSEK